MIEIKYESNSLKELLKDERLLFRELKNNKLVDSVMAKMRFLEAAHDLYDVAMIPSIGFHPLTEDLSGLLALEIPNKVSGYRVVFLPLNGEDISGTLVNTIPPNPKLKTITQIHILDRCDYHKPKNKKNLKEKLKQFKK